MSWVIRDQVEATTAMFSGTRPLAIADHFRIPYEVDDEPVAAGLGWLRAQGGAALLWTEASGSATPASASVRTRAGTPSRSSRDSPMIRRRRPCSQERTRRGRARSMSRWTTVSTWPPSGGRGTAAFCSRSIPTIEKAEFLRGRCGMALIDTHPDYLVDARINVAHRRLLERYAADETARKLLPREVSAWWRRRAVSSLERSRDGWIVNGPAASGARVELVEGTPWR